MLIIYEIYNFKKYCIKGLKFCGSYSDLGIHALKKFNTNRSSSFRGVQ